MLKEHMDITIISNVTGFTKKQIEELMNVSIKIGYKKHTNVFL